MLAAYQPEGFHGIHEPENQRAAASDPSGR